jgi:hypothetical protein
MTLREARVLFSSLLATLPAKAKELGYELAYHEVYRPEEMARLYKARGVGVYPSSHTQGLAADVVLYRDAKYLPLTEDYASLGAYWKGLHPDCRWGGDFKKPDGNHFSLKFQGVA